VEPKASKLMAPPTNHRTPMNAAAARTALVRPLTKSTRGSMASRASSAMRNSGFEASPPTMLSW
jgi:hypothetical protein